MAALCPPPHVHSTIVMVALPLHRLQPCAKICIFDRTHGLAPIDLVVCPEARGTSLTTLIREKGATAEGLVPHNALSMDLLFSASRYLVSIGLFFHLSLCCMLGSHPVYVLCDATALCLFLQQNRLASTT